MSGEPDIEGCRLAGGTLPVDARQVVELAVPGTCLAQQLALMT